MKHLFLFLLFIVIYGNGISQNIINVKHGAQSPAYFSSLQEAITAANAGDSIYVWPSPVSYGDITIDKKLTIIGTGYDVALNATLGITTHTLDATIDNITYSAGSDHSTIMGCSIRSINVNTPTNVTIYRNRIRYKMRVENADSTNIRACYFDGVNIGDNGTNTDYNLPVVNSNGVKIENNIFYSYTLAPANNGSTSSSAYDNLYVDVNSSALIDRNIFRDRCVVYNSQFINNISVETGHYPFNGNNSYVANNIFASNEPTYAVENIVNFGSPGICQGYPSQGAHSFDSRFKLAAGSPAEGYALDGGDCGVFAGVDEYKLSGIPPIPLVYELQAPSVLISNDTLQVSIKIRTEN